MPRQAANLPLAFGLVMAGAVLIRKGATAFGGSVGDSAQASSATPAAGAGSTPVAAAGTGRPGALADVLRWKAQADISGKRWGVPPAVLLGLIHEESGGKEGLTSSAGAGGLTQFMPATATSYGVNVSPGHAVSQIDGAAHYLHDLLAQYHGDLHTALAAYAAGPGNLAAGQFYANNVLGHLAPLYQ